jgi:hypothetical protein
VAIFSVFVLDNGSLREDDGPLVLLVGPLLLALGPVDFAGLCTERPGVGRPSRRGLLLMRCKSVRNDARMLDRVLSSSRDSWARWCGRLSLDLARFFDFGSCAPELVA